MTVLPRRVLLAFAAVLDVALLARAAPLPAKQLAGRHDLMPRHLESLLQELVRARILKSLRGPRGGYELARERRRISLGDILRAVEGQKEAPARSAGSSLIGSVIEPTVAEAAATFLAELDRLTVDDLCRRAEAAEPMPTAPDFAI